MTRTSHSLYPLAACVGRGPFAPSSSLKTGAYLWRAPHDVASRTEEPRNTNVLGEASTKRGVVSSALRRRVKVATDGSLCMTHRAEEKVVRRAFFPLFQTRGIGLFSNKCSRDAVWIASCLIVKNASQKHLLECLPLLLPCTTSAPGSGGGGGGAGRVGYLRVTMEFQTSGPRAFRNPGNFQSGCRETHSQSTIPAMG